MGWDGELRPESELRATSTPSTRACATRRSCRRTSQPSVGDFLAVYRPLVRPGSDVLSIHIAEGLSGTCESAREAARLLAEEGQPGRVEVLDGADRRGRPRLPGARWRRASRERGGTPREIALGGGAARARRLDIWFCLDTLEYLRRGGRIGAAQAMVGTALKIKPILTFGTEIAPVGPRAHAPPGARADGRLPARAARARRDRLDRPARAVARATPSSSWPRARALFGSEPLFCTEVGPVLGAHLGSGVLVGGMTRPALIRAGAAAFRAAPAPARAVDRAPGACSGRLST